MNKDLEKKCLLVDEEKLVCSLVSKYPLIDVVDVIDETSQHLLEKAIPIIAEEIKNWGDEDCPHHALTRHTGRQNKKRERDIRKQPITDQLLSRQDLEDALKAQADSIKRELEENHGSYAPEGDLIQVGDIDATEWQSYWKERI